MISRARRAGASALTWLYVAATAVAAFLWLTYRIVHHMPRASWLETGFGLLNVPVTPSLVSAIGLGLIAAGLLHRKRLALVAVGVFQAAGIVWTAADLVNLAAGKTLAPDGRDVESVPLIIGSSIVSIAMAAAVVWLWPAFRARVPRGSWLAAGAWLLGGLLLAVGATHVAVLLWPGASGPAWQQTATALLHAVGLHPPQSWHGVQVGHLVPQLASAIMGVAILAAVYVFLRSWRSRDQWQPEQEIEIRRLLSKYGDPDSLGYVATRRDKLLHFGPHRRAAIGYQVFGGVCLAAGDPIGDPLAWDETIGSWEAYARDYGWTPAVLACSETGARAYARTLGFEVIRLGDEAILHPETFRLDSTSLTEVRRAWQRLHREGVVAEINWQADLSADSLQEVSTLADKWRTGDEERGFSMEMGRLGDPADGRLVVVWAKDSSGTPLALLTFNPWGRRGLSLDVMRRTADAPNGVMEFMVAELMTWSRDHGITQVSLNFAVLRHVFARAEDVAAAPLERVSSRLLGLLDHFWQLQRLYRANAKYHPKWQPRYLAVASLLTVPGVAHASMVAEGFLPDWSTKARFHRSDAWARLSQADLEKVRALEAPPTPDDWLATAADQPRHRMRHLTGLRATGRSGYPIGHRESVPLSALPDPMPVDRQSATFAGRVRAIRHHGRVCFADLTDQSHTVQLLLDAGALGRASVTDFAHLVDVGDLLEVQAVVGRSRSGTPSWLVGDWTVVAKALRPVPFGGLADPQARARDRSLDLIVHPDQLELLKARSRAIGAVRATLVAEGFTEVETPILGTTNGGASARPFRTHINAYDTDLVLRIAPELPLKRLLVGGIGPIFEIGRNFRNEGTDASHNPEFTVVEAYQPFADYHDMRLLTRRMIEAAAVAVHGRPVMPLPDESGAVVLTDISGEWPVVAVCEAVSAAVGEPVAIDTDLDALLAIARGHEVAVRDGWGPGAVIEGLYDELVEHQTVRPTFYVDFPEETSPLTAPHRDKPGLVERWDLVAGGMELGTAYSELTDALVQRQRLVEQSWKSALGDPEAMEIDEDFLGALELGMPPTGGLGIGLDRLVMALTGTSIRQVLSFPFVKPR